MNQPRDHLQNLAGGPVHQIYWKKALDEWGAALNGWLAWW
jgi:hypothetical protein